MAKKVATPYAYDRSSLANVDVKAITPKLLNWWDSLDPYLKILYTRMHPNSKLTLAHLGKSKFDGWDNGMMKKYHRHQVNEIKKQQRLETDRRVLASLAEQLAIQSALS